MLAGLIWSEHTCRSHGRQGRRCCVRPRAPARPSESAASAGDLAYNHESWHPESVPDLLPGVSVLPVASARQRRPHPGIELLCRARLHVWRSPSRGSIVACVCRRSRRRGSERVCSSANARQTNTAPLHDPRHHL